MSYTALKSGDKVYLQTQSDHKLLESRVYKLIPESMKAPMHLEEYSDFTIPNKIYGEPLTYLSNKVLKSFTTYKKNVGVLLAGLKGTGKSLQLKHLAMQSNMPVIIVSDPIHGTVLTDFLEKAPNSCVVLFDEFEKVYREREVHESILSLLDGLSTNPHIFVLTVNGKVSSFLEGRPSRIRYKKTYGSLSEKIIREIASDLLDDKSKVDSVVNHLYMMEEVNIDMAVSLIQDINLYPDESISKIAKTFNLEDPLSGSYDVHFFTKGLYFTPIASKNYELIEEIENYCIDEFDTSTFSFGAQVFDPDRTAENMEMYEALVKKFPGALKISDVFGKFITDELPRLSVSLSKSVYLYRSFKSNLPYDYMERQSLSGEYISTQQPISLKVNKNKSFDIFCDDTHVGVAERSKIMTTSLEL